MKCQVSYKINKGSYVDIVKTIGARNTVGVSNLITNVRTFDTTIKMPKTTEEVVKRLNKNPGAQNVLSYVLSGTSINGDIMNKMVNDAARVDKSFNEKALKASGLLNPALIATSESFFNKAKKIVSTEPSNVSRVVFESSPSDVMMREEGRNSVVISDASVVEIRKEVKKKFGTTVSPDKVDAGVDRVLSHIITSALYRGYDVEVKAFIKPTVMSDGIGNYNRFANTTGNKVVQASTRGTAGAIRYRNINTLFNDLGYRAKQIQKAEINRDVVILNSFLSPHELKVLTRGKRAGRAAKILVAEKITDIFKQKMPGLEVEMMSQFQIQQEYGATFSNKNGFIIGSKIVLNIDQFTESTLFHEFGHFYMKWLKQYKPGTHRQILDHTARQYEGVYKSYEEAYAKTGHVFSKDEIYEEIFVDKFGLKAAEKLMSILPIDYIQDGTYTKPKKKAAVEKETVPVEGIITVTVKDALYEYDPTTKDIISVATGKTMSWDKNHGIRKSVEAQANIRLGNAAEVVYKSATYVVDLEGNILSMATGKTMKWPENHGGRIDILNLAEPSLTRTKETEIVTIVHKPFHTIKTTTNKVYDGNIVYSMRPTDASSINYQHFGNPWTGSGVSSAIKAGPYAHMSYSQLKSDPKAHEANIDVAVKNYSEWLLGNKFESVAPKQRAWILDQISSGRLNGKQLQYMTSKFEYYSHADALADIVATYSKDTQISKSTFSYEGTTIDTPFPLGAEQSAALRGAIDHVNGKGPKGEVSYTIQGSAGTGKTTIIGLLNKYMKNKEFIYMTPTHAANVQLAKANLANGINQYPFTVASSINKIFPKNSPPKSVFRKKADPSGPGAVIIVDEASMFEQKDLDTLIEASATAGAKIIFMGDSAQIPMKNNRDAAYRLSSVFNTINKTELNKVYRQNPNALLRVLTKIRKNNKLVTYHDKGSDKSLQYLDESDYNKSIVSDFVNNTENTLHIAYTNAAVDAFNRNIKQKLSQDYLEKTGVKRSPTELHPGDKIVGHIGKQGKSAQKQSLANSIPYIVRSIKENRTDEFSAIELNSSSSTLQSIKDLGIKGVKPDVKTKIYPLSQKDSIMMDSFGQSDFDLNNKYLAAKVGQHFNDIADAISRKAWSDKTRAEMSVKDFFLDADLGGDYVYNIKTDRFEPLNTVKHTELYKGNLDSYLVKKGVSYGYSVTAHKSQGMTVANVYVDVKNIQEARQGKDELIVDGGGNQVNTFKNSLYYVAMSRASNKVVIDGSQTKFSAVIDSSEAPANASINDGLDKALSKEASETVETFMDDYFHALVGTDTITREEAGFDLDSSISDIFNIAAMGGNSAIFGDMDNESLSKFKEFFVPKATPPQVFGGLMRRGMIKQIRPGVIVLTDELGNRVDENGNFDNNSEFKFHSKPKDTKERMHNRKILEQVEGYITKFQNLAEVLFSVGVSSISSPTSVVDTINNGSKDVELTDDESQYSDGKFEYDRTTTVIDRDFSQSVEEDFYAKKVLWKEYKKTFLSNLDTLEGRTDAQNDRDASVAAHEYIENTDPEVLKPELDRIKAIFEFKTQSGTFLHNANELYVRTLNFSQKLEYDTKKDFPEEYSGAENIKKTVGKIPYTYFQRHIEAAMASPDIHEVEKYFEEFFFSRMAKFHGKKEYDDFKAIYDDYIKNFRPSNAYGVGRLLDRTGAAFNKHIFQKLKGPLTLMPEVKLSSKHLGVAGKLDLIVVDGNGVAHIFDYKTKAIGKRRMWDMDTGTHRMSSTLSTYSSNAMMKASVQTSIYKIILMEMGIEVGKSAVFYVENRITNVAGKNDDDILNDPKDLNYTTESVTREPLVDVTAEVLRHFSSKEGGSKVSPLMNSSSTEGDISTAVSIMSGGSSIEVIDNVRDRAERIYDNAINKAGGTEADPQIQKLIGSFGSQKKMTIILPGLGGAYDIPSNIEGREDRVEHIQGILEDKFEMRTFENQLHAMFYGGKKFEGSNDTREAIKNMLGGATSESHTLVKMSSDLSKGDDFVGISLLKDNVTGKTTVIVLNPDKQRLIPFGEGNTSVYGNYISNRIAHVKNPGATQQWRNDNYSMRLIKVGLAIAHAKKLDPSFEVNTIISNKEYTKNSMPRLEDLDTVLRNTKIMLGLAIDAGDPLPTSVSDMASNPKLWETESYLANPVSYLGNYLEGALDLNTNGGDMFNSTGRKRAAELLKMAKSFDPRQDYQELLVRLHEFRLSLERHSFRSVEDRVNSPIWAATDEVILFLHGMSFTGKAFNTTFISNYMMATSMTSNAHSTAFNRKIQQSTTSVRTALLAHNNDMQKVLIPLAAQYGINLKGVGKRFNNYSKVIFKKLYKGDNSKVGEAFILKDPNDSSLSVAEKDFLVFFNKTIQKNMDLSTYNDAQTIPGWMPLINKSKAGSKGGKQLTTKTNLEKFKETIGLNPRVVEDGSADMVDEQFNVENIYKGQFPGKGAQQKQQYNQGRRDKLGVDEFLNPKKGRAPKDLSTIEDNLQNVLDSFVVSSLETHHYKDVTAMGRAMVYQFRRQGNLTGESLDAVINTVAMIQKRVIKHETSEGTGGSGKGIKFLNDFTHLATISGTISQALLETFTNPFVTSANYLADKIYGSMYSGTREFSLKSYKLAAKYIWTDFGEKEALIEAIDLKYGISNSDTAKLKAVLNDMEKKLFRTESLMYVNELMLRNWQRITMVAYMIEQGSFDAHSLDSDGNLKYDESKDKRFYIKDPDESIHSLTKDELDRWRRYEATKEELAKQAGGLTINKDYNKRKMINAWTGFDNNYVKEMIVDIYSSMDEASKSLSTYYTFMGFLTKMKSWVFGKIPRYFQKPKTAEGNKSLSRLVKTPDSTKEGGFSYRWEGDATEGIFYTIKAMALQLAEYKTEYYQKRELTDFQKKNMSKLMTDITVSAGLWAAILGSFALATGDDDEEKNPLAILIRDRAIMATGDVFVVKSLWDMVSGSGSMFISFAVAGRAMNALSSFIVTGGQLAAGADEVTYSDFLTATNNVGRIVGIYRSGETVYDTLAPSS